MTASANFSDFNGSKKEFIESPDKKRLIEKTKRLMDLDNFDPEEVVKTDKEVKKKLLGMDSDFEEENEFRVYARIKK